MQAGCPSCTAHSMPQWALSFSSLPLRTLLQEGTSVHPHPAAAAATVPRRSQQWGDHPSLGAPASCRGGKQPQRPALPGASPVPRFLPCVLFINHSVLFFFFMKGRPERVQLSVIPGLCAVGRRGDVIAGSCPTSSRSAAEEMKLILPVSKR